MRSSHSWAPARVRAASPGLPLLANGKVDPGPPGRALCRRAARPRLLDPAAHPLPRHHRARGRAAARRRRLGGVVALPGVRRRHRRGRGWPARARPPTSAGRSRCATRAGQRHRPGHRSRARARDRRRRRLPHRQGQGRRARPGRSPTTSPASRPSATRSAPTDWSGSTPTAPGTSTRRSARSPRSTGPPAGWSTSSSPCMAVEDLAVVRRRVDVPIAADESIRRAEDPYRVRDLEAADIAVLKVQPLGGVRACLRIAEDIGLPVVVSQRRRVQRRHRRRRRARGRPARAAPRLRAGDGPAAHRRRRGRPAAPGRRDAAGAAAEVDDDAAAPARGRGRPGRPLATAARVGRAGSLLVSNPSTRLARDVVDGPARRRRARGRPRARAPATPRSPSPLHDAAQAGVLRLHTRIDERTAAFLALGLAKVAPRRPRSSAPPARRSPTCTRPSWRRPTPGALVVVTADRPAAAAGDRRQPDDRPGRRLRRSPPTLDVDASARPDGSRRVGAGRPGPVHLNVQLDDPLMPDEEAGTSVRRPTCAWRRLIRRCAVGSWSSTPARAPSSSPVTTPARPPGCSPRRPGGRCSRSRPAAAAPATP